MLNLMNYAKLLEFARQNTELLFEATCKVGR